MTWKRSVNVSKRSVPKSLSCAHPGCAVPVIVLVRNGRLSNAVSKMDSHYRTAHPQIDLAEAAYFLNYETKEETDGPDEPTDTQTNAVDPASTAVPSAD